MKTIVLSANPTPNMNLAKINIDSADFDPHRGPGFWVTFYNPNGNIIDRVSHKMAFDQWQDWTSESSEIEDYKYIADCVTEDIGVTYISMDYPLPPVAPLINMQPISLSIPVGTVAYFSVGYTGDAPFTFQWYKDNVALENQTNAILNISSVSSSDAGSYTVTITNDGGSATSSAATLAVIVPAAPTITMQPQNKTIEAGSNSSISIEVQGTEPLTFVWSKDGTAIPNAIGSVLPIYAQKINEGIYSVTVSNAAGSVTSNDVTVTVTPAPEPAAP